ncbi:MAG: IS200/IS605 family transposase [Xenococcaceae cyanobacterium MO_167.B52]|nr:IS200/IS605 family transposase [Xenococcaceae cyanobacterium MO_167.B52]
MNHAAFEIYYHITFQVKYRHKCITLDMLTRMESIFRNTLIKWRSNLVSFSGEVDHIHMVIETHPSLNLSQLIANLKTVSSRYLRKEYAEHLSKYFWKRCAGMGGLQQTTINCGKQNIKPEKSPLSTRGDFHLRSSTRRVSPKERAPRQPYFWSKSYGIKSISRGADLDKIIEYVQNQEKPAQ